MLSARRVERDGVAAVGRERSSRRRLSSRAKHRVIESFSSLEQEVSCLSVLAVIVCGTPLPLLKLSDFILGQ